MGEGGEGAGAGAATIQLDSMGVKGSVTLYFCLRYETKSHKLIPNEEDGSKQLNRTKDQKAPPT